MNEYDAVAVGITFLGAGLAAMAMAGKFHQPHLGIGSLLIGSSCVVFGLSHFVQTRLLVSAPSFASEAEFLTAQKNDGYVSIGKFDMNWPATYVDEITGEDEISFTRQDGTPHQYTGFRGYRLKVVRLRDGIGREPMFVLRSRSKR
jgi:hypothetical protein